MTSQSSSIEHSEKQPPYNSDLANQKDKLKLNTPCNNLSENMEDMRYNDAGKVDMAKTSSCSGAKSLA